MSPLPDISQIASFRRRLGVTQKRIAIESGVSQSLISKIEAGRVVPTYDNAKLIIDALERIELESESVGMRQDKTTKRGRSLPVLEAIRKCKGRIGVIDTTFSNIDTASIAIKEIKRLANQVTIRRYTVPGLRDIPLACKILIEREKCGIVLATGMVSRKGAEKQVENQAVQGIMLVQLQTGRHVITAFFDEHETRDKTKLYKIVVDRVRKHAQNSLKLLAVPESLTDYAGLGLRQGGKDVGQIRG
jgi:riboflavin synthase